MDAIINNGTNNYKFMKNSGGWYGAQEMKKKQSFLGVSVDIFLTKHHHKENEAVWNKLKMYYHKVNYNGIVV